MRRRPIKLAYIIGCNQEDNVPEALETNVRQGAALGVTSPCAPAGAAQAHSGLSSSTPQVRLECPVTALPRALLVTIGFQQIL